MTYQAKKNRPRLIRVALLGMLAAATVGVGYWQLAPAGHAGPAPAAPATATVGEPIIPPAMPSDSPAATPAASTPAAPVPAVTVAPSPRRSSTTTSGHPAAATTPAPARVIHRAPAPVGAPVDPHPAPAVGQDSCHAGETWDGTQCVAMQNPDEVIGRQVDGPNGEVCTVTDTQGHMTCTAPKP